MYEFEYLSFDYREKIPQILWSQKRNGTVTLAFQVSDARDVVCDVNESKVTFSAKDEDNNLYKVSLNLSGKVKKEYDLKIHGREVILKLDKDDIASSSKSFWKDLTHDKLYFVKFDFKRMEFENSSDEEKPDDFFNGGVNNPMDFSGQDEEDLNFENFDGSGNDESPEEENGDEKKEQKQETE